MKDLQQILGRPSDTCIVQTMKHTTQMHNKGNRVTGVLHPHDYVKKCLPRLSARCLKGTICTDTMFCSGISSVNRHTCFQLFWSKLSKFLYTMPLKIESKNSEALEEFISQIGVLKRLHFDNTKSQVLKK